MDLVERYLQAVKFWLPKAQREDIAAELSEELHARIEELESELGHALHEDEIVAILRQSGAPVLVANRYQPQRSLIGPVLFPSYLFVLKITAICYLVPWLFMLVGAFRLVPQAWQWSDVFGHIVSSAFISFSVITMVFAGIERLQHKFPGGKRKGLYMAQWDPRKLPPLRDARRIPRSSSIADVVANLVFAIWLASGVWGAIILSLSGLRFGFSDQWKIFYWANLVLALANVTVAVFNLYKPYWTRPRILLRLGLDCTASALFCWLLKADLLTSISAPSLAPARAAAIVHSINAGLAMAFPYSVLICVGIVLLTDMRRLRFLRPAKKESLLSLGRMRAS